MDALYDSDDEQTTKETGSYDLKISNKIVSCDRKKIFTGTAKYIKSEPNIKIKDIKINEIKLHQRLFYKNNEKEDEVGYIEVFQNSSLSYSHQLSEYISFLFECDSQNNKKIDNTKCFGFRYYDLNGNYCTLLKSNNDDDDDYYFLEKLEEYDNEFFDKKLDCFNIIFDSIFTRYKKHEKKNGFFDFPLIMEMPLYEVLGFSYSVMHKSTDKIKFHKFHSIEIMTDEDFTSYIPKLNDKTIVNIMPITFDGHISLLYFTDIDDKRYFLLSDPSHVICKPFEKSISKNPFVFEKNLRNNINIYPKVKIQAFNSCSLWYYFQILCLINYKEEIQNRKYIEAKDLIKSIKDSSFYIDCFNYYQFIMGFNKKLIEINPNKIFDDDEYFYYISTGRYLKSNIKIHKLCFLNQFVDFNELASLIAKHSLKFNPGINELNEFRAYNEELIDFYIYLNYNVNFLELNVKKDVTIIKILENKIDEIKEIRNKFIKLCNDFLSGLIKIHISEKDLVWYNSEISKKNKYGKYLEEIYNKIKDIIEYFHQKKNETEKEFDLYPLYVTGKILVPFVGLLYKSK